MVVVLYYEQVGAPNADPGYLKVDMLTATVWLAMEVDDMR